MRRFFLLHFSLIMVLGYIGYQIIDLFERMENNNLYDGLLSLLVNLLPLAVGLFFLLALLVAYKKMYLIKKENNLKEFVIAKINKKNSPLSVVYSLTSTSGEKIELTSKLIDVFKFKEGQMIYIGKNIIAEDNFLGQSEPLTLKNFLTNRTRFVQCYNI